MQLLNFIDLPAALQAELFDDFRIGPIVDFRNGKEMRRLDEKTFDFIGSIKVSTFPREIEVPHFRLDYQGVNCRYNLLTGEPMDRVPSEIARYGRNITKWYNKNKAALMKFYDNNLADNAPPQSKISSYKKDS